MVKQPLIRTQGAKRPFLHHKELSNRFHCRCSSSCLRMSTNLSDLMHLVQKAKFLNAAVEGKGGIAQEAKAQPLQS